jgi:hypothetical protein
MEIPGFMPTRRVEQVADGFIVYVKPPAFVGTAEVRVFLTPDQYTRYKLWREGPLLIQEALFDLDDDKREMLMTGLGDEDFHRIAGDDE